jgi:putative Mg2+ transporter-C (MgtC) family protein
VDIDLQFTLLGRAALAALLGFLIGLEREYRGKSAGDRTFALLSFAAALITGMGAELLGPDGTSRVIQGVVTGVGFLGGGLIFRRSPGDVLGLTTAASSWAVTAVGVIVGVGGYLVATLGTALVLVILELDSIPVLRRIRQRTEASGDASPRQRPPSD